MIILHQKHDLGVTLETLLNQDHKQETENTSLELTNPTVQAKHRLLNIGNKLLAGKQSVWMKNKYIQEYNDLTETTVAEKKAKSVINYSYELVTHLYLTTYWSHSQDLVIQLFAYETPDGMNYVANSQSYSPR